MKIGALIVGILVLLGSGLGCVVCLALPGMNSHVSVQEAMIVFIPLALLCFISFIMTVVAAILVLRGRRQGN